jgi:hypothetical protein
VAVAARPAAWAAKLDTGTVADHIQCSERCRLWNEPDLAGLRDGDALEDCLG